MITCIRLRAPEPIIQLSSSMADKRVFPISSFASVIKLSSSAPILNSVNEKHRIEDNIGASKVSRAPYTAIGIQDHFLKYQL